jgi:hypothetical protein
MEKTDKQLALIFEFQTAPQGLKDAATLHKNNIKKLEKAQQKVITAGAELETAKTNYESSDKAFRLALNAWTPQGE